MMSNNNINNTSYSSTNPLSKESELRAFESSFFPAGGAPKLANIPQAPPAPKNLNNLKTKPINLKTRNWGGKLENGYSGINRSLYDRPNVFYWDSRPVLNERAHVLAPSSNHDLSKSSHRSSNIPQAPPLPHWNKHRSDNLIRGKKLRTRNWGSRSEDGWSKMNRKLYNREYGLHLELNVIINELWAQLQPKNKGTERGIDLQQQTVQLVQQPVQLLQQPVQNSLISTVTRTHVVPLANAAVPMYASGISAGIPLSTTPMVAQGGLPNMMGTGILLNPGMARSSIVPTKRDLKAQQKLLKKQNKRDAKLRKKGIMPPTSSLATQTLAPVSTTTFVEPVAPLSNNIGYGMMDRGLTGVTSTGIIGPVATTVVGGSPAMIPTNSFVKHDSFVNAIPVSAVGSPMM